MLENSVKEDVKRLQQEKASKKIIKITASIKYLKSERLSRFKGGKSPPNASDSLLLRKLLLTAVRGKTTFINYDILQIL